MGQKFLVTGGAGFIGSHVVDELVRLGLRVIVIDNLSGGRRENLSDALASGLVELICEDVFDIDFGDERLSGVTHVIHMAGIGDIVPSVENPTRYMKVNLMGTCVVLELARALGAKRFVYAASSSCFGLAATPTNEDHSERPEYPYALSKLLGEQAAFHWGSVYGIGVNSICIFNAYGPRVKTTGAYGAVFGVFFKQMLEGKPLTVVGDGSQARDFVYVTDVARAFVAASTTKVTGERFNIGTGQPQTINSLLQILDYNNVEHIPWRPGEPHVTCADIDKAINILGWQPSVMFEDGVKKMLAVINEWSDAPLWDVAKIEKATASWYKYLERREN